MPQMRTWYSQMDGLRFIAITTVLIEHFAYGIGSLFHAGYFGVDLFFVISGFLITEGLLINKEQSMPKWKAIRHFYAKRFLRIFPIYYLVLSISLLTYPPFHDIAAYAFTYTVNYYTAISGNSVPEVFGHLWSLSVEEQFYIFWPFIIIFIPGRKPVFGFILIIMFASLTYFLVYRDFIMLQSRMFSLCFGALLAYLKLFHKEFYTTNIKAKFWTVFALATVFYFMFNQVGISIFSLSLVYLGSNTAFTGVFKKLLEHKWSIYIGKISYGVYLYHLPLAAILGVYVFDPVWNNIDFSFLPPLKYNSWLIKLPLFYACTVGLAHLSYRFIESPILKLKKRLKEEPTASATSTMAG